MQSWLEILPASDFSLNNIPFGIFSDSPKSYRAATRLGDFVIDLFELANAGLIDVPGLKPDTLKQKTLNEFIRQGKKVTQRLRAEVQLLFATDNTRLRENVFLRSKILHHIDQVQVHMPVEVGDYTDFYSSIYHATNVGSMFRPDNPLLPNWKHLPVAYHGRASSIVITGTPVKRPCGQFKPAQAEKPVFGPTQALDFELELAYIVGKDSVLGTAVEATAAEDHIFGFVIFNDWSARDIQAWEYQPLGPFLSKNFISSVSPWIVTLEALAPFRVQGPAPDEELLPYLRLEGRHNYNIQLEVYLQTEGGTPEKICASNFRYMYWNIFQQLAHHTVGGCNVRVGDMMASGTISGPEENSRGCLLELTWGGKHPIQLEDGSERKYLQDGDTLIMKGFAGEGLNRVGFGEVRGTIVP